MKEYKVGNFTFKPTKIKYSKTKSKYFLDVYFKGKKIDYLKAGENFDSKNLDVAANKDSLLVKLYRKNTEFQDFHPPLSGGYINDNACILKLYDVSNGANIKTREYREDENNLEKAEEEFKKFNQPTLKM